MVEARSLGHLLRSFANSIRPQFCSSMWQRQSWYLAEWTQQVSRRGKADAHQSSETICLSIPSSEVDCSVRIWMSQSLASPRFDFQQKHRLQTFHVKQLDLKCGLSLFRYVEYDDTVMPATGLLMTSAFMKGKPSPQYAEAIKAGTIPSVFRMTIWRFAWCHIAGHWIPGRYLGCVSSLVNSCQSAVSRRGHISCSSYDTNDWTSQVVKQ